MLNLCYVSILTLMTLNLAKIVMVINSREHKVKSERIGRDESERMGRVEWKAQMDSLLLHEHM